MDPNTRTWQLEQLSEGDDDQTEEDLQSEEEDDMAFLDEDEEEEEEDDMAFLDEDEEEEEEETQLVRQMQQINLTQPVQPVQQAQPVQPVQPVQQRDTLQLHRGSNETEADFEFRTALTQSIVQSYMMTPQTAETLGYLVSNHLRYGVEYAPDVQDSINGIIRLLG